MVDGQANFGTMHLEFWTNENNLYIMNAFRCNPNNWTLCFNGDSINQTIISGNPPSKYERPIAVLLGPLCMSMGDINAYRLSI